MSKVVDLGISRALKEEREKAEHDELIKDQQVIVDRMNTVIGWSNQAMALDVLFALHRKGATFYGKSNYYYADSTFKTPTRIQCFDIMDLRLSLNVDEDRVQTAFDFFLDTKDTKDFLDGTEVVLSGNNFPINWIKVKWLNYIPDEHSKPYSDLIEVLNRYPGGWNYTDLNTMPIYLYRNTSNTRIRITLDLPRKLITKW